MWHYFLRGHTKIKSLRLDFQILYNPAEPRSKRTQRKKKKKKQMEKNPGRTADCATCPGSCTNKRDLAWVARARSKRTHRKKNPERDGEEPRPHGGPHVPVRDPSQAERASARPKPGSAVRREAWVLLRPIQVLLFWVLLSFSFCFFFFFLWVLDMLWADLILSLLI